MVLLTRSADLRQARQTSTIDNVLVWADRDKANPTADLRNLLNDLGLLGCRIGVEYDTHGLTARNGRLLDEQLKTFGTIEDASDLISRLRLVKSEAEIKKVERAAGLADDAFDAALPLIGQGGDEAAILAAMQGAVLGGGGDYPANEFVIGSGADALLCRYKAGRRKLTKNDQLTLEWAGVYHHYHAAMMRTVLTGKVSRRHQELFDAAQEALLAVEKAMRAGQDVRRRVRRARPHHGGARHDPPPPQRLRLFARRPLRPVLDGPADVLFRQPRADRAGHDAVCAHDHHGLRCRGRHDAGPHLPDDRRGTADAVAPWTRLGGALRPHLAEQQG